MNKRFFITYADDNFALSGERIIREASDTNEFDGTFLYKKEDLSKEIQDCPLLNCQKGGGYWIWKPDIVLQTFEKIDYNDVLVYVDAGCFLYRDREWSKFWKMIEKYDALFFRIGCQVKQWVKKDALAYYNVLYDNSLLNNYLIAGGVFMIKKNESMISLMKEWKDTMIFNPDLLTDIEPDKIAEEHKCIKAHRHDQAVLTLILYRHSYNIHILWENFESRSFHRQAILARRVNCSQAYPVRSRALRYFIRHCIIYPYMYAEFKLKSLIWRIEH
jgi:hypothetical protein